MHEILPTRSAMYHPTCMANLNPNVPIKQETKNRIFITKLTVLLPYIYIYIYIYINHPRLSFYILSYACIGNVF
jgi:hypothetical protein